MRSHTTLSRAYTGSMAGLDKDNSFSILRAGNGDADLARQAVAEVHGRTPVDPDSISEFLHNPAHYLILALNGGQVVGSLMGYRLQHPHRSDPQFLLYEIDVRTEHRSRGIGRALVAGFIREAKDAGAFEVWVLTSRSNKAAMKIYAHCGLRPQQDDDVMLSLMLK
jgi:ribosomal protein S18 acetylase RimI-like enzyme